MPLPHPAGYEPPRQSSLDRRRVLLAGVILSLIAGGLLVLGRRAAAHAGNALPHASLERALVVQRNLTINQIFGLFGGFTVLGFLLVGGTALAAVSALAVAYLSGTVGQQNGVLITFAGLLLIGVLRVWWVLPAAPDRLR